MVAPRRTTTHPYTFDAAVSTESHVSNEDDDNDDDGGSSSMTLTRPQSGDIVTLENLVFTPQNDFIPEPLFDLTSSSSSSTSNTSTTTMVLDGGHYLPGLHEIIRTQCCLNSSVSNISIDAGYGHYRSDLVFHVPLSKLQQSQQQQQSPLIWKVGSTIRLQPGDISVLIKDIVDHGNVVVLDANAPLAGSTYGCSFKLTAIHRIHNPTLVPQTPSKTTTKPLNHHRRSNDVDDDDDEIATMMARNGGWTKSSHRYQIATFALGCFWGAELAYMRTHGVVGTRVGYTNGIVTTRHPTYNEVCNDGSTQQSEAVQIVYDASVVSYSTLVDIAIDRIRTTTSTSGYDLHRLFRSDNSENESKQYRHGIYFHTKEQYDMIQALLSPVVDTTETIHTKELWQRYQIEICPATTFWEAEDYHQQYLYKGGQSARKGATEPIRCYG